jgi:hypothetical protein
MSKDSKPGKIQFVFVNVEGDQETLQNAIRQVGGILNQGMQPPQPKVLIAVPTQKSLSGGDGQNAIDNHQVFEVQPQEQVPQANSDGDKVASGQAARNKREKKAPKTPAVLKDFDPNEGDVTFSDYVGSHNSETQINKYLLIAAWFKRHRDINEIDTSHIYTCFQLMKWPAPDDMGQPFRDMKAKNSYFDKGSKLGSWEITIVGLNEVDRIGRTSGDD